MAPCSASSNIRPIANASRIWTRSGWTKEAEGQGYQRTGGNARHAGFHKTDTIDYAIVIEGEIVALMDEGEKLMKQGDVLIQRGTNHAWANRTDKPARVAFILIDAKPVP